MAVDYYHGGKPGLSAGAEIVPAAELGHQFGYEKPHITTMKLHYRPENVYITSHLGTALGYAARYKTPLLQPERGDVYLVEPAEPPVPDPDYEGIADATVAMMCSRARIVEVVERSVYLSLRDQNRLAWPHCGWGNPVTNPMYTEDGTMIASAQMLAGGVDPDYMALLPKWIDVSEVNAVGQVTREGYPVPLAEVLDTFSHLDLERRQHKITVSRSSPMFRCSCSSRFEDKRSAALHKLDERAVRLIAAHNVPRDIGHDPVDLVILTMARRSGGRWRWYTTRI